MVKRYTVAGVSRKDGVLSVRYANAASRAGVLERNGHTDVELYVFAEALAKEDIVDELLNFDSYNFSEATKSAILEEARSLGFRV